MVVCLATCLAQVSLLSNMTPRKFMLSFDFTGTPDTAISDYMVSLQFGIFSIVDILPQWSFVSKKANDSIAHRCRNSGKKLS